MTRSIAAAAAVLMFATGAAPGAAPRLNYDPHVFAGSAGFEPYLAGAEAERLAYDRRVFTGMGGPMEELSGADAHDHAAVPDAYPPCTRSRTDRCIQTRGRTPSTAAPATRRAAADLPGI